MKEMKGNRTLTSGASPYNQLEFLVQNYIKNNVNTALPVKVTAVYPGGTGMNGYVDVLPLIQSYDGFGNAIPSQTIFHVPYMRVQGGSAALIIDPVPGDIGLAIFSQQDITGLNKNPQKPLIKRSFSMADALYIGGFLNQAPSIFLELRQDNTANLICPVSLNIQSAAVNIDAAVNINGNVAVNGSIAATQDIAGGSVSLQAHTHSGVESGSQNTGVPNG